MQHVWVAHFTINKLDIFLLFGFSLADSHRTELEFVSCQYIWCSRFFNDLVRPKHDNIVELNAPKSKCIITTQQVLRILLISIKTMRVTFSEIFSVEYLIWLSQTVRHRLPLHHLYQLKLKPNQYHLPVIKCLVSSSSH